MPVLPLCLRGDNGLPGFHVPRSFGVPHHGGPIRHFTGKRMCPFDLARLVSPLPRPVGYRNQRRTADDLGLAS